MKQFYNYVVLVLRDVVSSLAPAYVMVNDSGDAIIIEVQGAASSARVLFSHDYVEVVVDRNGVYLRLRFDPLSLDSEFYDSVVDAFVSIFSLPMRKRFLSRIRSIVSASVFEVT